MISLFSCSPLLRGRRLALRLMMAIIGCSLLCIALGGGVHIWL